MKVVPQSTRLSTIKRDSRSERVDSEPKDLVDIQFNRPGLAIQLDHSYHSDPALKLLSLMAGRASFEGVANPNYKFDAESSGSIPESDKPFLDRVTSLGKEAGIDWFYSFEKMGGCNGSRRSHDGFEMSFDNGTPNEILTPNGQYSFGSSSMNSNATQRFHELLRRDFEVETVVPQKDYIPQYSITGPLLRFTPKQPLA
ncbi:MAG: hypothetical protein KF760_20040 [Candidatus Eremiobacteraeota bacterium]|nr:hypothetical protein [Candidatus Eremiobacteraeota bacterium]MCW5872690.1 hypothetical protein [Candidatus Eremiobacteraeota bacterium]